MGRAGGKGFPDKWISMCKAMKIRESLGTLRELPGKHRACKVEACAKRWQVSCVPLNKDKGAFAAVERDLASSLQPFLLDPEPVILTSLLYLLWSLNQFSRLSTYF